MGKHKIQHIYKFKQKYQVLRNFKFNFLFLCQASMTIFLFIEQSKIYLAINKQFSSLQCLKGTHMTLSVPFTALAPMSKLGVWSTVGNLTPSTEIVSCLLSIPNSPHNLPLQSLNKKALLKIYVSISGP